MLTVEHNVSTMKLHGPFGLGALERTLLPPGGER